MGVVSAVVVARTIGIGRRRYKDLAYNILIGAALLVGGAVTDYLTY